MKLLGSYKNGNYFVSIFEDGTKIRYNKIDYFEPNTIESIDIKITNRCDMGCEACHENSAVDGLHGDILSESFVDKLHPYTELAIGGGNPLSHPDLIPFLKKCKELKLIPSMTVNQHHFMKDYDLVKQLVDRELIYGLGVSFVNADYNFIEKLKQFPNAVLHVINGLITVDSLRSLACFGLKILVLGYKEFRRGKDLYSKKQDIIEYGKSCFKEELKAILDEKWFKVISFDNLALKQLDVRSLLSGKEWEEFFMGDDGVDGNFDSATMYVDMVNKKFAKNSCAPEDERFDLLPTIEEMWNYLRRAE